MARSHQDSLRGDPSGSPPRQRNRKDKLRRIESAARTLFVAKGYDDATMREIARLADVGLGTLFLYAADKRDLLFLAWNDEHEKIVRAVTGFRPLSNSFLEDITSYFRELYEILGQDPDFTRHILREVTFYTGGNQADRTSAARQEIVRGIERLVGNARELRQIKSHEGDKIIAQLLFGVFQAEVRLWLVDEKPIVTNGIRRLRRMLGIVIHGLETANK